MENNTLLSHELEDMRSQINILKEKLEKHTVVGMIMACASIIMLSI